MLGKIKDILPNRQIVHCLLQINILVVVESGLVADDLESIVFQGVTGTKVVLQPVEASSGFVLERSKGGVFRLRFEESLNQHDPRFDKLGGKHLKQAPHLHRLCRAMQFAVSRIVHAEQENAIETRQFIVGVHAPS